MDLSLNALLSMARDSVVAPRQAARQVLALRLSLAEGALAIVLMAVCSTLAAHLTLVLQPLPPDDPMAALFSSPLRTAVVQVAVLAAACWALFWVGQRRGGAGTLPGAVALIAWLQFIMLLLQLLQIVVELLLAPFAAALAAAGVAVFFWLLTAFTMELHGFRSPFVTFLGVLMTLMMLGLVLALVLGGSIGLPQGGGDV